MPLAVGSRGGLQSLEEVNLTVQVLLLCCRQMLTDLGPSFIKAGQVLASRPDIVREDYMNELCTLQDDVPSFPDQLVRNVLLIKYRQIPGICSLACLRL